MINTSFAGLKLVSPIIVGSNSQTANIQKIVELEQAGAGAIVLKSLFEESILREVAQLGTDDHPEAYDYLSGYVRSIGIAFILLFMIGQLIMKTGDVTYLVFLLVYGVDGCLTICHRIMLHENLGEAHRKHAYQLMANELKIGHVKVSLLYMGIQMAVSLGFIYFCPNTTLAHWLYLFGAILLLTVAYVLFKKKYYHLHEEYLASLKK